jgi:hypothetical protein
MNDFLIASRIASCIARKTMGKRIGINKGSHGKQRKRPARRLAEKDHNVKLSLSLDLLKASCRVTVCSAFHHLAWLISVVLAGVHALMLHYRLLISLPWQTTGFTRSTLLVQLGL